MKGGAGSLTHVSFTRICPKSEHRFPFREAKSSTMLLEKFRTLHRQDPRTSLTRVRPSCQHWCVGANLPQITPGMRWADVETSLTPTTPWARLGPLCGNASYAYYTLDNLGLCVEMGLTPWTRVLHLLHLGHLGPVCGDGSYTLDTLGAEAGPTPITP